MTSAPVRDQLSDRLLTPENAAFLLIDFQPQQLVAVRSMDQALLVKNAVSTVRTIKTFGVPVVHSTVNVATGREQPTLPELAGLLTGDKPLDRTTINSWEDVEFVQAVRAAGAASSSSAPCGPKCAWPLPLWMRCATGMRSTPSSTRSAAPRPRPPGRPGPRPPSRRPAGQLGLARRRAAARLGPPGSRGDRRDRRHRPPGEGSITPLRRRDSKRQ